MSFSTDVLTIDCAEEVRSIEEALREQVGRTLRRKGIVVGVSGGIDSSVVTALAVRSMGCERVVALFMPERDSSPASLELGKMLATHFGIAAVIEDMGPTLSAVGCYARQDAAIRTVFPEYETAKGWTCKLTLPSILDGDRINVSQLTVRSPEGKERTSRMPPDAYRQLVAATNFKQRMRKMMEYYHADRLGYAVAGTPNRLEYDQGFFVKQGDGAADVKPIAHLYKTQVYQLAEYLGVPKVIRERPPTTDTFSMEQTQEEFYFALPYDKMDVCLYGKNHGVPAGDVAKALGMTQTQIERVYHDIDSKRRTTHWLHTQPLFVQPVPEISLENRGL
ncbi:MAG: NAD(+) synthase [Polyangiaceae bacterium]|nr:NAD(+) synthase [Polyangiaceae bacterium]